MTDEHMESGADGDREAVLQLSHALLRAVNASDLAGVTNVWSVDGLLMPPHHPSVRGRDAITEYFTQLFRRGRFAFEFTASTVEVAGGMAIERVEYMATFRPADGGSASHHLGKGLHVFQRQANAEWRLLMDIWNSDNPIPASNKPNGA